MKREDWFGDWLKTDKQIGKGGRGDVFVAYHRDDTARARPYALKRLRNVKNAVGVERFRKEINAALRLEHPGIVKPVAWDLGKRPFYVAPLHQKGHLTPEWAARLSPLARLRFFAGICHAVGHAHERGIIHRDIKPANVLITDDDTPAVADFGLCFFRHEEGARLTETFEVAGSRFFTAPELADGRAEDVTPATDVYSLGKLLYWLFSPGGGVFEREKHRDPKYNLLGTEPRTAHAFVYEILDRTIIEEPTRRYFQDANALAADADAQAERLEMDAHALNLSVRQQCNYCGVGEYRVRVDPRWWFDDLKPPEEPRPNYWRESAIEQARRYGVQAHNGTPWLILSCEHCGNVQLFQLFEGLKGVDLLKNWNLRPKRG
jgi:serine/threonine protein kinase